MVKKQLQNLIFVSRAGEPEPGVFGSLEPEPLQKKYQEPEPLGKKIRSRVPLTNPVPD